MSAARETPSILSARVLALVGLIAFGLRLSAGQAPPQRPSFRTGVDLVQVDVSVLDPQRQPVPGLTAADFTVREDGKERPVVAFSAVDLPARPAPPPAVWMREIAPDVITNAVPREGRLVVILFDRTIRNGTMPAAKRIAEMAVDQLGPADLAAVIYTARGVPQNFTADRRLLRSAIARPFLGLADGDSGNPGQCRCGVCTLESITRVADALRDVPQRRKMLLFIGTNIPVQDAGDCSGILKDAREKLFRAADVANLTIHAFDSNALESLAPTAEVRGPARSPDIGGNLQRQGNLSAYPDHTGGRTVLNTNAPERLVSEIFSESRSYYVLGFEPANPKNDGHFHDIKVTVKRQGVAVHPRRGYYAPSDPARNPPAARGGPSASLVAVQAGLWPRTALPLSVTAAAFENPGKSDATVAVVLYAHESLTDEGRGAAPPAAIGAQQINVLTGAYDQSGKSIDFHVQKLEVTPQRGASALDYEVVSRLTLKPGRHEIRVSAENVTRGTSGSVYTYVDVPDFSKGALSLSGVVLGRSGGSATASPVLGTLLPLAPIARREFAPADHVTAFVRAYQGGNGAPAGTLTTRILDDHNRAVFEQAVPAFDGRGTGPASQDHQIEIPLAQLTPGEYLLTMSVGGQKPAAMREVRFTVR
ncbi:MAG: VWA domain-containing protein [Acidobacteriota bacterium]